VALTPVAEEAFLRDFAPAHGKGAALFRSVMRAITAAPRHCQGREPRWPAPLAPPRTGREPRARAGWRPFTHGSFIGMADADMVGRAIKQLFGLERLAYEVVYSRRDRFIAGLRKSKPCKPFLELSDPCGFKKELFT
jgi:hypothetical protein